MGLAGVLVLGLVLAGLPAASASDDGGGLDATTVGLVVAIVAVLVALAFVSSGLLLAKPAAVGDGEDAVDGEDAAAGGGAEGGGRARRRVRGMDRLRQQADEDEGDEGDDADLDMEALEQKLLADKSIGKKKREKLLAKAEKRKHREEEEARRADAKEREALRAQQDQDARKAEEDAKKAEEAAELLALEEQRRKEQEEYEAMKAMFSVEEGGNAEDEIAQESQSLLQEFVDFIKAKKVVQLEDLATNFKLKTKEAIARLKALEELGRISGVMDDRGKYIYLDKQELEVMAKWIKQSGRVSISEICEKSSDLIKLSTNDDPPTAGPDSKAK